MGNEISELSEYLTPDETPEEKRKKQEKFEKLVDEFAPYADLSDMTP